MTTKMTKTSHLIKDQAKLKIICDDLCDNITDLLDTLGLEYKFNSKMICMACPIHGGDNKGAINLYPEGERYRGNWKCRTHNCENIFKSSIIGFVRGVLSNKKYQWEKNGDKACSFEEALDFSVNFLNKDYHSIVISKSQKNKQLFTNAIHNITQKNTIAPQKYTTRDNVRKSLKIPAQYYIDRGYSPEILDKYDVGLCDRHGKEMYKRIVVPIYDNDYRYMIGCTGRSIYEECELCSSYHDPVRSCPSDEEKYLYSKWKHNKDFKSKKSLYNFWFAKKHIMSSTQAIIVESPGNVWKLEENGIHNSVGIYGSSIDDNQKILLDSSGAMTLIVLTDNDIAGEKAKEQIIQKCKNTYRIFCLSISKPDVGEMTSEEIEEQIKKPIRNIL